MDETRITWLNERLPRTRAIGHALIRDHSDRILLCELTYKLAWDLPGGVVEPNESPLAGCLREVAEELGVLFDAARLVAVNWLPPWRGWDDANVFLFDLGAHDAGIVAELTLQQREIAAVHWCTPEDIAAFAAPATARLLATVAGVSGSHPVYLEDGAHAAPPGISGG